MELTDESFKRIDFTKLTKNVQDKEFCGVPGDQHYQLLATISTYYENRNIIDLGTHLGHSAYALSYNETNTVFSFDIITKPKHPSVQDRKNIHFIEADLFEEKTNEKWRSTIENAAIILMDVDPHNGKMEYEFYNYLKSINFKGLLICDDVWFFKEMRDNFWYKIPNEEKLDISKYGHWSGTGLINFGEKIEKNTNENWTLVTGYFNLTKCEDASQEIKDRDDKYYMSHAVSTMNLPYNLVVYCDEISYEKIKNMRPENLKEKTKYVIREFDEFAFEKGGIMQETKFREYRNKIIENRKKKPYVFDNRNTASYYLFCMSRYAMLKETIKSNVFGSTQFCWINFCIERMGYKNVKNLDEALSVNRERFSTCYIDYVPKRLVEDTSKYYEYGRCGMCSGFFTGNAKYMYEVCDLIEDKFVKYVNEGYGHADEQLYSAVYFENPGLFEHYFGDYQQMITNYVYIYENAEAPIRNLIKNSYLYEDYKKCNEACKFVWNSYLKGKCKIEEKEQQELYKYYMKSEKKISEENNIFISKN